MCNKQAALFLLPGLIDCTAPLTVCPHSLLVNDTQTECWKNKGRSNAPQQPMNRWQPAKVTCLEYQQRRVLNWQFVTLAAVNFKCRVTSALPENVADSRTHRTAKRDKNDDDEWTMQWPYHTAAQLVSGSQEDVHWKHCLFWYQSFKIKLWPYGIRFKHRLQQLMTHSSWWLTASSPLLAINRSLR